MMVPFLRLRNLEGRHQSVQNGKEPIDSVRDTNRLNRTKPATWVPTDCLATLIDADDVLLRYYGYVYLSMYIYIYYTYKYMYM